jgi:hypothetical protein
MQVSHSANNATTHLEKKIFTIILQGPECYSAIAPLAGQLNYCRNVAPHAVASLQIYAEQCITYIHANFFVLELRILFVFQGGVSGKWGAYQIRVGKHGFAVSFKLYLLVVFTHI